MKTMRTFFLALLLLAGTGITVHAGSKDHAVIVMPVRYTVVQFAFDVARIRPVELLAYDKGTGDEPLLLHVWDAAAGNWKPADLDTYQDGSLFAKPPKRVFLVGDKTSLPAELTAAPAWAKDVTPIASLKVLDMANTMDGELNFSGREWKKLAARHNLELVDENADKRRYGRYGKPGTTYTGPRKVNPLIARFRSIKKDEPAMEEAVEDAVDIEPVETVEAADEPTEAAPDEATEAAADVPEAKGEAEEAAADTGMTDETGGDDAPADVEEDVSAEDK